MSNVLLLHISDFSFANSKVVQQQQQQQSVCVSVCLSSTMFLTDGHSHDILL